MNRIYEYILSWLQGKCNHPDSAVKLDILQGENYPWCISWCEKCGAFRRYKIPINLGDSEISTEWRRPQPTWDTSD